MSKLSAINSEITKLRSAAADIEARATAEGRDLTADEAQTAEDLLNRAADLRPQLDREIAMEESVNRAAAVTARFASPAVEAQDMTAGEFLASAFKMRNGLISKDEHIARAAKYFRAQQATTDNAGILPTPIVGNVLSLYDARRPVWNSFTARPMPAEGKTFTRPEITQHVATGNQASEFATVSSQKMTITGNTVTKFTEAGYLDLSQQDIDWTSPAALDLVVQDFVDVFSNSLEARAVAYLATLASASVAFTTTNIGTVVTSIMNGVKAVYDSSKQQADTLWLSLDEAIYMSATFNSNNDKSAIALLKDAVRDMGGFDLNIVVGHQLSADTRIVGFSGLAESYLQTNGLIQVAQPDVLGQRLAYSGYGALWGKAAGFVKLV